MSKEPIYKWDSEHGEAICEMYYNGLTFIGSAFCHPDDKDMQNELTGIRIAEYRALIKLFQYRKKCELQPKLAALKQLYYSMNRSKEFNPKSYENKMLFRQIRLLEDDLDTTNEELAQLRIKLNTYIKGKEITYQFIRKKRSAKNS